MSSLFEERKDLWKGEFKNYQIQRLRLLKIVASLHIVAILVTFTFFPQAYMENFEQCAKRKRKKNHFIICPRLSVVVFPPLFLNFSLYVILDIPEVPAFKKRAKIFGR